MIKIKYKAQIELFNHYVVLQLSYSMVCGSAIWSSSYKYAGPYSNRPPSHIEYYDLKKIIDFRLLLKYIII